MDTRHIVPIVGQASRLSISSNPSFLNKKVKVKSKTIFLFFIIVNNIAYNKLEVENILFLKNIKKY